MSPSWPSGEENRMSIRRDTQSTEYPITLSSRNECILLAVDNALSVDAMRYCSIQTYLRLDPVGCAEERTASFVLFGTRYHHAAPASPVRRIDAQFHKTPKARIGPLRGHRNPSMFHRVPMNIVDVPLVVAFVTNEMLPEPALPNPSFTAFHPTR